MIHIGDIYYDDAFAQQFRKLPKHIQKLAIKKEEIFRKNPLHPSLRLHKLRGKLEGLWSISITMHIRIIFEIQPNADLLFISIGHHSIYKQSL